MRAVPLAVGHRDTAVSRSIHNTSLSQICQSDIRNYYNNNNVDFEQNVMQHGPTLLPVSASMVEVLRHHAKSASQVNDNEMINSSAAVNGSRQPLRGHHRGHKDRYHSAHTGFILRLRFLDSNNEH